MATTAPPVVATSRVASGTLRIWRSNVLVSWHLLSLDAPCVAMLWSWFIAKGNHVDLPLTAVLAMGLAVWMLYAADRLLDARLALADAGLEPRHFFHRNRQRPFLIGIAIASLALGILLPGLAVESLRLDLVLGSLLVGYFIVIHVGSPLLQNKTRRMPKELAVGVFFSAAIFIPTVARQPALRLMLLPVAVLFAVVCSLNCLFIYAWEHPQPGRIVHPATRLALRYLAQLSIAAVISGLALVALAGSKHPWTIPAACTAATTLLMLLHRNRTRLDPTTLRACGDLCLLAPVLFVPLLQK